MQSLRKSLLLLSTIATFGGLGFAQGCVITTDAVDCEVCDESPLCHNHIGTDENGVETCFCDQGYTWEDPNDPDNLECERIPSRPGESNCSNPNNIQIGDNCNCESGYVWCDPDDPNNLTCCIDEAQDSQGSGDGIADEGGEAGTGGMMDEGTGDVGEEGGEGGDGPEIPPQLEKPSDDMCTEDGLVACSNNDPDNPFGSTFWLCQSGEWVEDTATGNDSCEFDQFDFAYGCYNDGDIVQFSCGNGPGTDCTAADDTCEDSDTLTFCLFGKLTTASCTAFCQDPEQQADGVTFSAGSCDMDSLGCFCCDEPVDGVCETNEAQAG